MYVKNMAKQPVEFPIQYIIYILRNNLENPKTEKNKNSLLINNDNTLFKRYNKIYKNK